MFSIFLALILFIIQIPIKTLMLTLQTISVTGNLKSKVNNALSSEKDDISLKDRLVNTGRTVKNGAKTVASGTKNITKTGIKTAKTGVKVGTKLIKFSIKAIKALIQVLKMILLLLKAIISFLVALGTIGIIILVIIIFIFAGAVGYTIILSMSDDKSLGTSSSSGQVVTQESTQQTSNITVASDWKEVNQGSYADVAYSKDRDTGGVGNVRGQGCGLCAIYVVSEHYSGNSDIFTIESCASEVNDKFPKNGTNVNTAVVTKWFNEMHTELGLSCSGYIEGSIDLDRLDGVLSNGGCAIVCYHDDVVYSGRYVWTSGGHYVTIIGGNQSSGYTVRDSNGNHWSSSSAEVASSGVPDWCPYHSHVFSKEYIKPATYHYFIEKK